MYNKYYMEDSFVHRLNPVGKLISLILVIIFCFFSNSNMDLVVLGVYVLSMLLLSKIDVLVYIRLLVRIIPFTLFIFIFVVVFRVNIVVGILKILLGVTYFLIFILTTTLKELIYSFEYFLKGFGGIPFNIISLNLAMYFRMILIYDDKISSIYRNIKLRRVNKVTLLDRINNINYAFNYSLKEIDKLKLVYYVRFYEYSAGRSNYLFTKWGIFDTICLGINLLVGIFIGIF